MDNCMKETPDRRKTRPWRESPSTWCYPDTGSFRKFVRVPSKFEDTLLVRQPVSIHFTLEVGIRIAIGTFSFLENYKINQKKLFLIPISTNEKKDFRKVYQIFWAGFLKLKLNLCLVRLYKM